jgi:hypothetical protein
MARVTRNFRRGISISDGAPEYRHLKGILDTEALLSDLGIDFSHWHKEHQAMCHCPDLAGLHENGDRNPSFGFNDEKLVFNCFQCGGGNVLELVQMMKPEYARRFKGDHQKDQDTISYLEQFADFNARDSMADQIGAILNQPEERPEIMPDYPPDSLFQYRKIHSYLYERGLTKDVIVQMQVGFDDDHGSIVIPHFFQGKLVGIQRRHLAQDDQGNFICPRCEENMKSVPKYKNTPNFPKVNTLYGYDQMKQAMLEEDGRSVIVVESPFSALKLKSLGFHRVVATFGQFSKEQGMLLIAVPTVYYWPDNDYAGLQNAWRSIASLGQYTSVKIVPVLPDLKGDPGDLTNPDEVTKYLQNAYSAALFKLYSSEKLATLDDVANTNQSKFVSVEE